MALNRGIPFGDLSGLLTGGDERGGGGKGGGPGGPGRGTLFGQKPGLGGKGGDAAAPAHIVYVLDTSGSMNQGDKIGKAKDALRKALLELKPGDSFNIITFDTNVRWFASSMIGATRENVTAGLQYVESIQIRPGTNLSGGLEKALAHQDATHIFVLSDGEPSRGIVDATQLRAAAKAWNKQHAQILTLALGLGEQFRGIPLLKGLAEDNDGKFSYINLAK
jgi:Ca-activated chloride channel family protein